MNMVILKYTGDGELSKAHEDDIGFDVSANKLEIVYDGGYFEEFTKDEMTLENIRNSLCRHAYSVRKLKFDTGIAIEPCGFKPNGLFWIMACANSRVCKTNFVLNNGVGIIDPSYRGTVRFIYVNTLGRGYNCAEDIYMLCKTCGQFIPMANVSQGVVAQKVEYLSDTERGEGGFGSTAK